MHMTKYSLIHVNTMTWLKINGSILLMTMLKALSNIDLSRKDLRIHAAFSTMKSFLYSEGTIEMKGL
jgi:hypothetical protein